MVEVRFARGILTTRQAIALTEKFTSYERLHRAKEPCQRLDNALELLRKSKRLTPKDKVSISAFVENLKARRVNISRIGRYVYHLRPMGENLGTTFDNANRKDIESFIV
jgi:hypothetical protein